MIGYLAGIEVELDVEDHQTLLKRFNPDFQEKVGQFIDKFDIDKPCLCVKYKNKCRVCPFGKATEDMEFDDRADHELEACRVISSAYNCQKYMFLSFSHIEIHKDNLTKARKVMRNIYDDLLKFKEE